MNHKKLGRSVHKAISRYASRLDQISDAEFNRTPGKGGWSYSEVYSHIFDSTLLSLMAISNCIKGEGRIEPTAPAVKAILFFGMLPPGKRYKVPKRLADRVKKISRTEAAQLIENTLLQFEKVKAGIPLASTKIKVAHPRLGYLNAAQWLRFIEIHFNHHLKQLKRIEKDLHTSTSSV
ncbi:DinB superfamily protein [compost metagenome]